MAPQGAALDALSRHKAEIVALLRPGRDGWSGEDWQVYFDQRAGIAEFDGGLPRAEAGTRAFDCCVVEWLNRNPVCSPPGRCLGCGGRENAYDKLLPYGTKPTAHAWLHSLFCAPMSGSSLHKLGHLRRVHVLAERPQDMHDANFTGKKAGQSQVHAWFVLDRGLQQNSL